MQTIGLIGGMSWASTVEYYKTLNRLIRERCGKQHSAKILLTSVDFQEIEPLMQVGNWDEVGEKIIRCGQQLVTGGADFVMLCTNSPHAIADQLAASLSVPFIHIVDPVGEEIKRLGFRKVGLLGTRFTMEKPFFRDRLLTKFSVETVVPELEDREMLHRTIFEELVKGVFSKETKQAYEMVIDKLMQQGAEAVILGCTEIALLTPPEESSFILLDSTTLHCRAAIDRALIALRPANVR